MSQSLFFYSLISLKIQLLEVQGERIFPGESSSAIRFCIFSVILLTFGFLSVWEEDYSSVGM